MTDVRIVEEGIADLDAYETVPMTLLVERVYRVEATATGYDLHEEPVATPWLKDYETFEEDRPVSLARRYDFRRRGIFAAYLGETRVGGAIVAPGEHDWFGVGGAVLVDIRVAPAHQRLGVGSALIAAVVAWARARRLNELFIETQNVNVPGCRFYAAQGARLHAVIPRAYPRLPDEIKMTWRLAI
jgi:GNAT superfamily N-acetyltransferase